ncbi:hypothetical protein Acr_00g0078540 [Actinidia rufa]|uniref:CCHC-type domain-containing protein n=1 Tax=Actinidia rufa TaxID=165716 RepID=A0A7J0DTW3_9ERIC|nr:hypothetical protein Acr_00g0078540 [Actinidia rufa]
MGTKRGRARMVGRGRGGCGVTGRGTPIEDVGDQGVASQTQQGVDRGVISRGRSTRQGAGRGNPTPVVPEAHSGAGGRETAPKVPVIPSQFAREVAAAMLEMERTRHEEILGHLLSQIRKIFDTVRITEDDMKVSFASYQLVGEANEWWESIKEAKGVDRARSHPSECPQRVCYNYGQQGHISTNCPQGKNTHNGVGSVQQQSSGQTSNYQQRHQQQRNQSQQSRQLIAFE